MALHILKREWIVTRRVGDFQSSVCCLPLRFPKHKWMKRDTLFSNVACRCFWFQKHLWTEVIPLEKFNYFEHQDICFVLLSDFDGKNRHNTIQMQSQFRAVSDEMRACSQQQPYSDDFVTKTTVSGAKATQKRSCCACCRLSLSS